MAEQNSITQANKNDTGTITSSANVSLAPNQQLRSTNKDKIKPIIFLIIGVVAGLAVAALIYFVFLNSKETTGKKVEVYDSTMVTDGSKTEEETIKSLDDGIEKAKTDTEKIDATLIKAQYYMMDEEYQEALTVLQTINLEGLSDYDLYRIYNHYYTVYNGLGDASMATRYKELSNEAQTRDMQAAYSK